MSRDTKTFRVDLGLLRELGERLISRDEVAVVELVKNAYDADATEVDVRICEDFIEVQDNGMGMGSKEIQDGWLTIGTTIKKRRRRTRKGRRVLGEKGLGRLAVLRLGKAVTIETKKHAGPCYRIEMDWRDAARALLHSTFTPLEDMHVGVATTTETQLRGSHGTIVRVRELNAAWDDRTIERLRVFLSRLVEPDIRGASDFHIRLYSNGQETSISPPDVTLRPHYWLDVSVEPNGAYKGVLSWNMDRGRGGEKIPSGSFAEADLVGPDGEHLEWKDVASGGCGGFRFRLNVWDLDAAELRGQKQQLKEWGGVSLLRERFRVVQPDVDWLGLGLRRVQMPTLRLSTNQIIGNVIITSDSNPNLIDKTDREGLVECEAYALLRSAVYTLMGILERKRYVLRRRKGLSRGVIFSYLDTAPLRDVAQKLPATQKQAVEEYASSIDRFRGMLEDWILGRDRMATMGLLAARLVHEARSALARITDNYPLIEKELGTIAKPTRGRIERMVTGGRALHKVFEGLDPFLRFRGRARQDVTLRDVVEAIEFLFTPELRKQEIKIANAVPSTLILRAHPTDVYVLLGNFLDNSVYWLSRSQSRKRLVEFRARETANSIIIEVADSGPGIPRDLTDDLFDAGVTTKPQGTGLGLSIVRDIVESYGGRVEADDDSRLGGALFRITLPLKGG